MKILTNDIQVLVDWFHLINAEVFGGYLELPKFERTACKQFGRYGSYNFDNKVIEVDETMHNWPMVNTLLHEMIHQFQFEAGFHDENDHHGAIFHDDFDKRVEKVKALYSSGRYYKNMD